MKKVIIVSIIIIVVFLTWAPWINNQSVHDWALQNWGKIDGTIDKNGNLVCDYKVMWMPFGRYLASCEGGYYRPFWRLIPGYMERVVPELTNDQKRAVKIAVAPISYPVIIIEVKKLECDGCYSVKLQRSDNQRQFTVTLEGWKYKQTLWH